MPVSLDGDTVDWTQQRPSRFGHQGPVQLQEGSYTPTIPSTSTGISRQGNSTDSQDLSSFAINDSAAQVQGPPFPSLFQNDASLLNLQSSRQNASINGEWARDDHKHNSLDFLDDYSEPNPTVPLEQGLSSPGSAELEITRPLGAVTPLETITPLEACESKTSSPTPPDLVLSDTPHFSATDNRPLKTEHTEPVLEQSEELSQPGEIKAPNDGGEDDSDSAKLPSAEDDTDTESEADYDTCFGVVSQNRLLIKITEHSNIPSPGAIRSHPIDHTSRENCLDASLGPSGW